MKKYDFDTDFEVGEIKMKKIKNQVKGKIDNDYYYVPDEVSETEALIYDWVVYHFGKEEAENPSWNIHDLAQHLDEMRELLERIKGDYEPQNTIMYEILKEKENENRNLQLCKKAD